MVFNFGLAVRRRSDPKAWKKRMGLRSSVNHRRVKDEDTKRQNGKEKEAIREIVPGMKEDGSKVREDRRGLQRSSAGDLGTHQCPVCMVNFSGDV
jgi:hypothetical protein